MKRFLLGWLCCCCLAAASIGCTGSSSSSTAPVTTPVPFETVYRGCNVTVPPGSWPASASNSVIENQADLDSLWDAISIGGSAPTIDFDARSAIVARTAPYCNGCPTSCPDDNFGYDIEITSVARTASCVEVKVERTEPSLFLECFDSNAKVHIISIPKPSLPVCFEVNILKAPTC